MTGTIIGVRVDSKQSDEGYPLQKIDLWIKKIEDTEHSYQVGEEERRDYGDKVERLLVSNHNTGTEAFEMFMTKLVNKLCTPMEVTNVWMDSGGIYGVFVENVSDKNVVYGKSFMIRAGVAELNTLEAFVKKLAGFLMYFRGGHLKLKVVEVADRETVDGCKDLTEAFERAIGIKG